MRTSLSLPQLLALLPLAAALATAGCSPSAPGSEADDGPLGTSVAAVTATESITRAEEWVTAKLLYCQSPNGADDSIDPACSPICTRTSNPAWDPYRSDCSGLVSWAWGLPAPGRTTAELAPNQTDITSVIQASSLSMGDAVCTDDSLSNEHHIMLFKAWTKAGTEASFIEEPGCAANPNYAHEFTSTVSLSGTSITVDYNGITFTAIHYGALGSSSSSTSSGSGNPPPACKVNGVDGTCIDTSVCATMSGYVSTPGYCPGPVNEECCTPTASGAGGSSTSGAGGTSGTSGTGGASSMGNGSGSSGAGGSETNGATHHRNSGATGGCQTTLAGVGAPPGLGLAALAGLLLLVRRRRTRAPVAT